MTAILGTEVDDIPWKGSCLRRPLLDSKDRNCNVPRMGLTKTKELNDETGARFTFLDSTWK